MTFVLSLFNFSINLSFVDSWWLYLILAILISLLLYYYRKIELNKIANRQEIELKRIQAEKLAEINIEKSKFFSNVSHEFKTPLTLILGPLERLIENAKEEEQKEELKKVRRNARRMQTLVNQLLSLSKLESGKMRLKSRPENIVKLSRLFLQSFQSMADDKGIKIEFESDAEEHIVYIDTLKIEKVTNNLLSNAFKYTERGGKIKLSVQSLTKSEGADLKEGVEIKFCDSGIGISKEKIPFVFDRFYQVDELQMKTNLGTGIGLALTKELIELHHGSIKAESESGKGSTFSIFLPFGREHLQDNEISSSVNHSSDEGDELLNDDYLFVQDVAPNLDLGKETHIDNELDLILIVEDNDDMRSYIKSYLSPSYNIIEAANGKEGAEKAIELVPDLIVSDLMMPFVDGNEMTMRLKADERTSHIPIILLTARSSMEIKLKGLETGADDFLTKPFDSNELLIRIKNLIEQRKNLRILLSSHIGNASQIKLINESTGKKNSKLDELFIEKVSSIVAKHMSDPEMSVEMLSTEMAMSRVQLHRKLKSLTDHSPSDLIRDIRMLKAAELLKERELNVTQVSYEIGISSLSNFAKTFKEKFGVNPSEYH